jgi:hypothetical protein
MSTIKRTDLRVCFFFFALVMAALVVPIDDKAQSTYEQANRGGMLIKKSEYSRYSSAEILHKIANARGLIREMLFWCHCFPFKLIWREHIEGAKVLSPLVAREPWLSSQVVVVGDSG